MVVKEVLDYQRLYKLRRKVGIERRSVDRSRKPDSVTQIVYGDEDITEMCEERAYPRCVEFKTSENASAGTYVDDRRQQLLHVPSKTAHEGLEALIGVRSNDERAKSEPYLFGDHPKCGGVSHCKCPTRNRRH